MRSDQPTSMRRLRDICTITAGPSGALLPSLHDGSDGTPVITPRDLTEFRTISHQALRRLSEPEAEKLERFTVQPGDLVMVRQGSLGKVAVVADAEAGWLYNTSCLRLRPNAEPARSDYLAVYLSYSMAWAEFISQALASRVPLLTSEMLGGFQILLPSIERQQEIVETYHSIDKRIEIERAVIERLQELQRSLLSEMTEGAATWDE